MPKLKSDTIIPTAAESAEIDAASMQDPDAQSLSDTEWEQVKPYAQVGRPRSLVTKERITIRLSRDVIDRFRASGDGWQTRVDTALKDWLKDHTPA
jgi:uncharacterized protein (DUF4415 family)